MSAQPTIISKGGNIGVNKVKMRNTVRNPRINNRRPVRNYAARGRFSNSASGVSNEIQDTFRDGLDCLKSITVSYNGDPASFRSNRLKALCGFSSSLLLLPFSGGLSTIAAGYGVLKTYHAVKDRRVS